jgi:UTP--glucose-1-phosphate uridylyltransferase
MIDNISASFAPFEARMRQEDLPEIVIDNFRHYYATLVAGSVGQIPESDITPVTSTTDIAEIAEYASAGALAIQRAAVLKLNGGLGTSMGLEKAKSLLIARDNLTFLDIIAQQTIHAGKRHQRQIPLIFMNSFNTDADTHAVLDNYSELHSDIPLSLMQHKIPKILQETLEPALWPDNPGLEWCPPGHGEVYIALATSGMLDLLLDRGYEYLFLSNVDNLGATLDLRILGFIAEQNIPFLMEVASRTEADKKGGHIARLKNGQLTLREVAQCPESDLPAFQDIHRHRYFNTNNIWLHLPELKRILAENNNVVKLPMIRNAKTLDPKDSHSPPVFQLETAMGAAIAIFSGAQAMRVTRDRFMPVKMCSDLLNLRSNNFTLDSDYILRPNPARRLDPITIDLDPRYYKLIDDFEQRFSNPVPSLVDCARLTVQGDVMFEPGSVFTGNVQITNHAKATRMLAPTVIDNMAIDVTE